MTLRRWSREIDVSISLDEILPELEDEALIDELESRGKYSAGAIPLTAFRDELRAVDHEIQMGRSADARRLLGNVIEQILRLEQSIARELQRGALEIPKAHKIASAN